MHRTSISFYPFQFFEIQHVIYLITASNWRILLRVKRLDGIPIIVAFKLRRRKKVLLCRADKPTSKITFSKLSYHCFLLLILIKDYCIFNQSKGKFVLVLNSIQVKCLQTIREPVEIYSHYTVVGNGIIVISLKSFLRICHLHAE